MKEVIKALFLPTLWIMQLATLLSLLSVHLVAVPIRAFIYWGRWVNESPGWECTHSESIREIGIWCYKHKEANLDD